MQNVSVSFTAVALVAMLAGSPALAQGAHGVGEPAPPTPAGASPAQKAARRFPQPVRVGTLIDRPLKEPSDHQGVLGHIEGVVRTSDGTLDLVVRSGGLLGFGARRIAVPVDATALVGYFLQIDDIDPRSLATLPDFDPAGTTPLAAEDVIRIGLDRN